MQYKENQNQNVYNRRIHSYSRKLHPIDKLENGIFLKSRILLIQVATQNRILSHKFETETYSSLKILEFLSFQIAHKTAQTTQIQRDPIDLFQRVPEHRSSKPTKLSGRSVSIPNSLNTFTHKERAKRHFRNRCTMYSLSCLHITQ